MPLDLNSIHMLKAVMNGVMQRNEDVIAANLVGKSTLHKPLHHPWIGVGQAELNTQFLLKCAVHLVKCVESASINVRNRVELENYELHALYLILQRIVSVIGVVVLAVVIYMQPLLRARVVLLDFVTHMLSIRKVDGSIYAHQNDAIVQLGFGILLDVAVLVRSGKAAEHSGVWVGALEDDEKKRDAYGQAEPQFYAQEQCSDECYHPYREVEFVNTPEIDSLCVIDQ